MLVRNIDFFYVDWSKYDETFSKFIYFFLKAFEMLFQFAFLYFPSNPELLLFYA
jgi:hypothetical protein